MGSNPCSLLSQSFFLPIEPCALFVIPLTINHYIINNHIKNQTTKMRVRVGPEVFEWANQMSCNCHASPWPAYKSQTGRKWWKPHLLRRSPCKSSSNRKKKKAILLKIFSWIQIWTQKWKNSEKKVSNESSVDSLIMESHYSHVHSLC